MLELCDQRGGRSRAGTQTNLGISAQANLARLEVPELTGATALAQNYPLLSLSALMNQITNCFYSNFLFQLAVTHWKE